MKDSFDRRREKKDSEKTATREWVSKIRDRRKNSRGGKGLAKTSRGVEIPFLAVRDLARWRAGPW